MSKNPLDDSNRYQLLLWTAHACWWGTAAIVLARAFEAIPQHFGTVAILTLGGGIAASLALSRLKLGRTITDVFRVGLHSAISLSANVFTDTCIMSLDDDGVITSADHCDAIGWTEESMVGCKLGDLLVTRSHGVRKVDPGTSITSPMRNGDGKVFDARISIAILGRKEDGDRKYVATVSPVVNPNL